MEAEAAAVIRGTVVRSFAAYPDSPWMAGKLQREEGDVISFSGKVFANVGDRLELTGKWTQHPKFGRQFEAMTGIAKMNESPEALAHMLATDERFEGIGPARARKIVEVALRVSGDGDIASALRDSTEEIARLSGVAVEIVKNAAEVWNSKRSYFDALAALCSQGWTNGQASKIIRAYGENAATVVAADPYALIKRIARFGFKTVDAVAQKMGIPEGNPHRLEAGVAYCLDAISEDGSTWTTRQGLFAKAENELRPNSIAVEDGIRAAIERMIARGEIHVDEAMDGQEIVAYARLAAIEFATFKILIDGLESKGEKCKPIRLDGERARAVIPTLNAGQLAALRGFANRRFAVISGGAGVGKTYTMKAICDVAQESGLTVGLCAPTGKAAKRLSESTDRDAKTIHRILETKFNEDTGSFQFTRDASNPMDFDLVIVDEVSMVDVRLMRSLVDALRGRARLLLVGDHHQIPSVGPGAILRDILSQRDRFRESVHVLTEIVRQAGDLAKNTTAILDGVVSRNQSPAWAILPTERGDEIGASNMAAKLIESIVTSPEPLEPWGRTLDLAWDIQVLSPMRKGPLGTWALNANIQALRQRLLGNPPPEPTEKDRAPKPLVGDRVIWTQNDYELALFNGTQAIVQKINKDGSMDLLTEDDREVTIPSGKRQLIEVAYAITIHKAQGSQWPCVILAISSAHNVMRDRNLLYTGASRAEKSLTILGDQAGIGTFANSRKSSQRQTFGAFMVLGWTPKLESDRIIELDSGSSIVIDV